MGVPGRAGDGERVQQQTLWPEQGGSDEEQKRDCSRDSLLRNVTVLSHQQHEVAVGQAAAGGQHEPQVSCSSPAAADEPATARWLSLHRAVWSSGVFCVLAAALIFAVAALLVKLTGGRVPVLEITLIRSAISLVVSAALIRGKGIQPVMGHRQNIKWLIPRGVFGATAMTTFYAAILLLPLADGMTLFFLNPCLTAVAAWAFRGEPLGLLGVAGCLCSLVGMVVLIHPPMFFGGHASWGPRRIWGTGFGLVSAICCAGAFISIRCIGKSEPALVVALYFHLSTTILSGFPLAFGWPQVAQPVSWLDGLMLLGVAAGSFGGQLFLTRALQLENASLISSLNFSQVLYSYLFGIVLFNEHLTLFGVLGSLLVALGMVGVTMRPKEDSLDSAELSQRNPGSLRSSSEGARRLASFQRLLSRARGGADSSSDPHQQLAEGVPLRADEQGGVTGQVQVQMQHIGHELLPHEQQQQVLPSLQQARQQQQQQQHEQVVLLGQCSPAGPSDAAHSMHHRHTPTSPPGSPGQGAAAAAVQPVQQHQLFVPVPSERL